MHSTDEITTMRDLMMAGQYYRAWNKTFGLHQTNVKLHLCCILHINDQLKTPIETPIETSQKLGLLRQIWQCGVHANEAK